ncbi:hypothetical protein Xen7305DRAFT_00036550 [Xenococcus sp. PCC 7305]|uniref:hypothetical protein n=1 Tax=Xenococcus sp. PCC 7305 TaxID=102125 RepID=UPI0002AC46AB|nr:hypothetical protein [Xenococcus sp. PCC 7305]ELS03931.1 hypothetical protein Xen7305DRAFT_00036550 [Xenococcus sp. PCC 7305]
MSQLTLNLIEGSVKFNFSPEAARNLQQEIATLVESLKLAAAHGNPREGRPKPRPAMEYQHTGEVFLEVFCNPNIYPSPYAAKVLLTLRDDRIRLTSEAELTRLIEDINQYLES